MATKINERKMIEDNIFLYEQKLNSPIRRFIDKTFVPVRYWHIKANDTTVDSGYADVAEILGKDSPIRFSKIENLPIYGMDSVMLQLQETDQGLDTNFEGEGVIMADTIRPLQNDFFMITHLKDSYIFRVSGVEYDNLVSTGCYKINFTLEYIDHEKVEDLSNQTTKEFTCVMENIGTDERCIIEKSLDEKVAKIDKMYDDIIHTFLTFYYNERYNCLLADFGNGERLYDPFQQEFIYKHQLFKKKNEIDSLVMGDQFYDPRRKIKYERSMYRCVELRTLSKLSTFNYTVFRGSNNPETAFHRWLDNGVKIVDIGKEMDPINHYKMMSDEFVDVIRLNGPTTSKTARLIQQFLRNDPIDINDIDLELNDEIMMLDDANLEVFFYTPIVLYIIKVLIKEHLEKSFEEVV